MKKTYSFTLDSEIMDHLKEEAKKDNRSLSSYINLVLMRHLKEIYTRMADETTDF